MGIPGNALAGNMIPVCSSSQSPNGDYISGQIYQHIWRLHYGSDFRATRKDGGIQPTLSLSSDFGQVAISVDYLQILLQATVVNRTKYCG